MNSLDMQVLDRSLEWLDAGHTAHMFTVVQTWGSAPRRPGALLVVRDDGHMIGSVSGGCVEDDLADKAVSGVLPSHPAIIEYGVSRDEAQAFGIPCGGQLRIFAEPLNSAEQVLPIVEAMRQKRLIRRCVNLHTGHVAINDALPGSVPALNNETFSNYFGPQYRLLIIGANQLGTVLAQMAQTLEFDVLVCDPREAMREEWQVPGVTWMEGMPDDVVLAIQPDAHTAIVAVTHDPKLDDMALLEALKCDAFYVGALGSQKNQDNRRLRLQTFDISEDEVARLHGPIGLPIGSHTPAEIAISILAEIVLVRSQQREAAAVPLSIAGRTQNQCAA